MLKRERDVIEEQKIALKQVEQKIKANDEVNSKKDDENKLLNQ